jgi:hypothetical protein
LPEIADNLVDEYPNEHNVTLAKAIPVVAQQSKDVRMDNLALYGNFLTKVNLR